MLRHFPAFLITCAAVSFGQIADAHEFWIEPVATRVAVGEPLEARTYIGNAFEGEELANYPSMQVMFDITLGDQTRALGGAAEQIPAVSTPALGEGLHVLRYQSRDFQLTYETYADFLAFLKEADRMDLAEAQGSGSAPQDGIREVYFRYAKSLIAVGDGAGSDRWMGMPWELVALTNPYTAARRAAMKFELRFNAELQADAAVHVFVRAGDGTISQLRLRSDSRGIVTVPSDIGGTYMVNAIKVMPASKRMEYLLGATWQSLWASATYVIE